MRITSLSFARLAFLVIAACWAVDSQAGAQIVQIRPVADVPSSTTQALTLIQGSATKTIHVEGTVLFDDTGIRSASAVDVKGTPELIIQLTDEGSRRFAEIGSKYDGRRVAFVINGRLVSAPSVKAPIGGGGTNIRCDGFSMEEVTKLATRLNAHAK